MTNDQSSIKSQIQKAQLQLTKISDAPHLDAAWLMLHVLGQKESSWLQAHGDEELDEESRAKYQGLVERRVAGEPLAYLMGYGGFYGRRFVLNDNVLIPRPSTEDLIDETLKVIMEMIRSRSRRLLTVADVGTGSGCIAVTLALESPYIDRILATDISPAALIIARKNAQIHGVLDRIEFLEGNMLEPLKDKKIDLIVSNPPYLSAAALAKAGRAIDTAGLMFEPRQALNGGEDGQDFIRQIEASGITAIVEGTGGQIQQFA